MNFIQMKLRVQYTLGAEETAYNNEADLIKGYLNNGIINILTRTRPYTRVINLALTKDTPVYDMSNTILALVDLDLPGYGFLKRYSRQDVVSLQAEGGYGFAYEEPLLWISPMTDLDGQTIKAYGVFRPLPMSNDLDDPATPDYGGLPYEFHEAIVLYALWKTGEYVQHQGSGEGERWRVQYEGQDGTEGEIARIKRIIQKRVTPAPLRRRNIVANLGVPSDSGDYIGAR